ncbi:MAG: peptidylprolyl isomerase [Acidobacteriota bacterium]|nr:peptidylprolyl isomerase [Acidobacteriota bacterium]
MKKLLFPLIAICAFVTVAPAQQDTVVEEIVARVNNAIITRADLRRNQEQTAQDSRDLNLTQEQIEQRDANSLRDLIDQQLLLQKAADLGISADADLVKRLDDIRREMKATSMEDLQKLAEQQGVSFEEFKQNTKNNILTQKVIGSEVGSHVQVSREETQKFYEEHKDELSRPERERLSEILIPNDPAAAKAEAGKDKENALQPTAEQIAAAQTRASDIYQQLKTGAKFDELARKESAGATAAQGGDLGYFKRKDLASELAEKTFPLKAGEFTEPIHTRQGFIILRVTDHIQAGTPTMDQVREQIQEQLYSQKIQPALRAYLTKLRVDAYIDIKPGYSDSGASPYQTKLVYTSDSGPKTKQTRGKLGVGHKKTVVVTGEDRHHKGTAFPKNTSDLGTAKADVDSKEKAELEKKAAAQAAAARAKADAEEKERLSHMSKKDRERYLAQKKRNAQYKASLDKKDQKQRRKAEKKEKREAAILAWREKENAKAIAKGRTPPYPTKSDAEKAAETSDPTAPPQKKKINWF